MSRGSRARSWPAAPPICFRTTAGRSISAPAPVPSPLTSLPRSRRPRSSGAALPEPLRGHGGFDLVTAVAPYVPTGELRLLPADVQRYEPRLALDGGVDGLDILRRGIRAGGGLM